MELIQNTTQADDPYHHHHHHRPAFHGARLQAILILILGIGLIYAASPRFLAAGHRLPANAVLDRLSNGKAVDQAQLNRAEGALISSLNMRVESRALNDLALVNLHQATEGNLDNSTGGAWLAASARYQDMSLARSPANAFGWLRMTHLSVLQKNVAGGLESGAVATFFQSVSQSPFYAQLIWRQLDYAMLFWPVLEPAERQELTPQFLAGARLSVWRQPAAALSLVSAKHWRDMKNSLRSLTAYISTASSRISREFSSSTETRALAQDGVIAERFAALLTKISKLGSGGLLRHVDADGQRRPCTVVATHKRAWLALGSDQFAAFTARSIGQLMRRQPRQIRRPHAADVA